jgi:hypothetical protein
MAISAEASTDAAAIFFMDEILFESAAMWKKHTA